MRVPSSYAGGVRSVGRRLLRLVPELPSALRRALLLALARAPLVIGLPLVVRALFDDALTGRRGGAVVWLGTAVFGLYVADAGVAYVIRRLAARFGLQAVARVRRDIAVRLYSLPRSWHDDQDPGLLHALVVHDAER